MVAAPSPPEYLIQASIVAWLKLMVPHCVTWSTPNGVVAAPREIAKLKWTGLLPGMPDLAVALPAGKVLFLEVNRPGNYLEPVQRAVISDLRSLGHQVEVVHSIDEVKAALTALGIKTREAA